MTAKMHSFFEKRKWNDKRDTPQASLAPCRLHFLMFSALHAEKAALLRRKNAFGRTTALLAPRMPSQNKKAIPYGMTFCFGGDKRDRTADLMTASCDRLVISGDFEYNTSVPSAKSAGFCGGSPLCPYAFAHTWVRIWVRASRWIWRGSAGVDVDCNLNFVDSQVMKEKKSPHAQHSSPRFVTSKMQNILCQKHKIKNIKNAKFILTMPSRYSIL